MTPNSFAIFMRTDVHRPGCAVDQLWAFRKVVGKVRLALLSGGTP